LKRNLKLEKKIAFLCHFNHGGRGGSGYTMFNFRFLFVKSVYDEFQEEKKVLIKEVALREEKVSSPTLLTTH